MGIKNWLGFSATVDAPLDAVTHTIHDGGPQAASPSAHRRELVLPTRDAGTTIAATPSTATTIPTVYRCITLLTHTIQQLDLTRDTADIPRWLARPETYGPWPLRQMIGYWVTSLAAHGNMVGWAEKTIDGWRIEPINPERLSWRTTVNARGIPENSYPVLDGQPVPLALPGLTGLLWKPYMLLPGRLGGVGPIQAAAQNIGQAVAVDTYGGDVYGSGIPQGVLSTDQPIDPETASEMKEAWLTADDQRIRVLGQGLDFQALKLNPRDAAWLEAREFNAKDIARLFGIPAFMLDLPAGDSMTYQNTEDSWNQYLRLAVMPIVNLIEDALNTLLPSSDPISLVPETLLKPTLGKRAEIAASLATAGYDPADVATLLDLPLKAAKAPAPQEVPSGTPTV